MTKLSSWARKHPATARILIFFLHIILLLLAFHTGYGLYQLHIAVPAWLAYATTCLLFTAILCYPSRRSSIPVRNKRRGYIIRKTCDFTLAACSFILVCCTVNQTASRTMVQIALTAQALTNSNVKKPTPEQILSSLAYRDKHTLTRFEKRILKHEFNKQLKLYVKARILKDEEATEKAVLIILSIIGAVGLSFLLAGLACNISCNGSEALAIVVAIAGLAAIIALLIMVIRKIKTHQKKNKPETEPGKPAFQ